LAHVNFCYIRADDLMRGNKKKIIMQDFLVNDRKFRNKNESDSGIDRLSLCRANTEYAFSLSIL
ncbi:MAG TPA: hypothetical protein VEJ22_03245, partial [Nitrospirota bacterium]|nr:hypothetical protein [Nitrospirota bacterium]